MKLLNKKSGAILSVPPPNEIGESVVTINGKLLLRVFYGGTGVTLEDGTNFKNGDEFAAHLVKMLEQA